jgi:tRNA A-37 threonylcarbamoyl transferase component Bud32
MTDPLPTQIGKYQIVELVGEGAMGTVYRATDSVLGRTVAIKVMNASIARQPDHRQRFLREAQAAGSLQHPNVVTIYDLGELDGHLFIAMEFLHGTDLERLMVGAEPLKLQSKLDIIVDVLMGLAYAHKHGIIHRDIKPANIRVSDDGHAKIMDFGVAHLASSDITRTGLVVGTPSYMAPEQVTGGKAVPGTDIFAVGAVLYHLLTGTKPFDAPTLQNLFYKIVTDMPRPLEELKPGLPPALERIVQRAMAKDPANRYTNALDIANDIIGVRAELSGNAYASTASLTASAVKVVETYAPKPVPVGAKRQFNRASLAAAGAAILVIVIAWVTIGRNARQLPAAIDSPVADSALPVSTGNAAIPDTASLAAAAESARAAARKPDTAPSRATPPPAARERKVASAPVREQKRPETKPAPVRTATRPVETTPISIPASQPTLAQPSVRDSARTLALAPPVAPIRDKPADTPTPKPAPREEVAAAVAAYARAIESRDIAAVRRAYPGITSEQARGFEQFFQAARNINVTFNVTGLESSGNSADARLVGTYEYVTTAGKTERQPVSFGATLRYEGSVWRLTSVR